MGNVHHFGLAQHLLRRMIKDILRWLYWQPFRLFIQRLPFRSVFAVGRVFGAILYRFSSTKRALLERECSTIGVGNSRHVVKDSLKIFCQNELEVFIFPRLNKNNINSIVSCEGLKHLDNALSAGRGVMLLFAHFGANQMIMPAIGYRGYKMSQISAPPMVWKEKLPNKRFSRMAEKGLEIRWKHELSLPVKHINIFSSLKEAFLCLRKNEVLGVAIDGGGGKDRVAIDFCGRNALFSTGAMEIAISTGCTVLPTFMVRGRDGRHKMIIEPPLEIQIKEQGENTVEKNMLAFVKRLEEYVLKYPCHYLNFLALRTFMERQGDTPFFT